MRARIDWKFALGLGLTDPGFHFSVLAEFRARLVTGQAEHLLLDTMLERFKARGLVKGRGKQRTDSTHVLGAVRDLHLLELVGETTIWPPSPRTGCARLRRPPGLGATRAGSRIMHCPRAGRSVRRSLLRSARTGSGYSTPWRRRPRRPNG